MLPSTLPYRILLAIIVLTFLVICGVGISTVQAAPLTQAMLKLNRLAPNTPLSGVLCATPSSAGAGTEGRISVTFPTDFTLSPSSGDWTTSTTSLPSGSTPWPGINVNAQSVSGQTVTFSGNDLVSGSTTYCFNFSAVASSTGVSGSKTGTITTRTSSGTAIDTKTYAVTIDDDQIGVSAVVPANPTDFTASITQLSPETTQAQNQEIEYELTYGSLLSYATTSVTLQAEWELGTVQGSGVPTVEIVDYVLGSAGSAHNNTPPVIDLSGKRISWVIGLFPANSTKSLRFKLKTNNAFHGSQPVTFRVKGRMLGPGVSTSDSTVTSTYRYDDGTSPTTSPGGPTNTPGPSVAMTPTPPATPSSSAGVTVENVSLQAVSSEMASILVTLSGAAGIQVQYGTSPTAMNQQMTALTPSTTHALTFSGLELNTTYYFKIVATDAFGIKTTSDIFTFTTASSAFLPVINNNSFVVTSEKNLIYTSYDSENNDGSHFIILPPSALFEIQFAFRNSEEIKLVQLLMRNRAAPSMDRVLGVNNFIQQAEAAESHSPMLEIKPGIYTGRLETRTEPGYYELLVKINDNNGNIKEEKLSDVKVSRPFRILREGTSEPVENARVLLSLYNDRQRVYQTISERILPIQNPVFSNPDGTVPVVLPTGKYRAEIEGLGYEKKTVDFKIGTNPDEDYPSITLKRQPFNPIYSVQYILFVASELGLSLDAYVHSIGTSMRVYHFTVFTVVVTFLFLTLLAFSERIHVRLRHLPRYFLSLIRVSRLDTDKESYYHGIIKDGHSKAVLGGVDLFLSDIDTGKIIYHIKSNAAGKFHLVLPTNYVYLLTLEKIGYHSATLELHHMKQDEEQELAMLENAEALSRHEVARRLVRAILALSFEVMLLLTIGATLLLIFTIGVIPAVPFFALSIFNLVFWGLHEVHLKT